MNETAPAAPKAEKKVGPIVATLIIVLVLIIAALYLFAAKVNQPAIPTDATVGESSTTTAPANSPSDIQSLQSDLNGATTGLDKQNF